MDPGHPATTRLAPTPSGYLHAGNAVNFLLVRWLADDLGARVVLRIDDLDTDRSRPAYVDDIFAVLDWLGIAWDEGPSSAADLVARFSLELRRDAHYAVAQHLLEIGQAYPCACSRRDGGGQRCVAQCRAAGLPWRAGQTALRLHIPAGTRATAEGEAVDLAAAVGDPILWRREGQASYHLANVVEDQRMRVTHVVRGADLRESSALHVHLAGLLGADAVAQARYLHHPLLVDAAGGKLSKSQLRVGPMDRTPALAHQILDLAEGLAPTIGISPRR